MADKFNAQQIFSPLAGLPGWHVTNGYGSWISINFGNPKLKIREPVADASVSAFRDERQVTVRGDYWLWIENCDWIVMYKDEAIAHSESDTETINQAIRKLDGQILKSVDIDPNAIQTRFKFDLSATILIKKSPGSNAESCLWHLYTYPDEHALSFMGSGCVQYDHASTENPVSYLIDNISFQL